MPSKPSLALLVDQCNSDAEYSSYSSPSLLQGVRFVPDYDTTGAGVSGTRNSNWHPNPVNEANEDPPRLEPTPGISILQRNLSEFFVVVLHILLIAIHGVLLVTFFMKLESRIVMPLTEGSGLISTLILIVSQIFVISFTAVLLFLTQRIANQRLLTNEQSLTTGHDTVAAWTGLGAALMTLVRQYTLPAAVTPIAAIAAYLGGLVVLHATTPSLFSLQLFNETSKLIIATQKYSNIDIDMTNITSISAFEADSETPAQALPLTVRLSQSITLGLRDNMLYDVVYKNNSTGTAVVEAISFTTSCGTLPINNFSASIATLPVMGNASYTKLTWQAGNNTICDFDVPYLNMNFGEAEAFPIWRQDPNLGNTCANWYGKDDKSYGNTVRTKGILFTSALVFMDSNGSNGSLISITSGTKENVSQIMGYELSYEKHDVTVNVQTREIVSAATSPMKNESFWSPWNVSFSDPTVENPSTLPESWPAIFAPDQSNWVVNQGIELRTWPFSAQGGPATSDRHLLQPYNIPIQENFILNHLPNYNSSSSSAYGNSLKDLENSLSIMTATYYWTALQMFPEIFPESLVVGGNTTTIELGLKYRLKLNLAPVVTGLATSITLTALALFLTKGAGSVTHKPITSLGVLQTIWLLNRYPDVCQTVANVEVPTVDNLRAAGMVSIQLDSLRPVADKINSNADEPDDDDTIEMASLTYN